jgi:beta-glucosidase/6-phospho-beta-glucosidase/beta-galactosidase
MTPVADFLNRQPKRRPFLFATGIECSCPVITGKDGKDVRVDEFERVDHYKRWREDFGLLDEIGVGVLRYGEPSYRVNLGPGRYNWDFLDETLQALRDRDITVILDLCHFGVPDWLESFQNPDFPRYFAEYARACAKRYPWIQLFTPVNEIFVASTFSGLEGWWNERLSSQKAFVTALKHCCKATLLAEEAILEVSPRAVFVHSEATSYFHAESPESLRRTHFLNQRRFLSLDLIYGLDVCAEIFQYLVHNGMTPQEYNWLMEHGRRLVPNCVMGNDYYATNEHMVPPGEAPCYEAGLVYGYYILTRQYYERYRMPVMHTETNQLGREDAPTWLRNQWLNLLKLKEDGVPLVGFTWYGLLDQVDWDTALRKDNGHVNPLGLFGLDRKIRPVGRAYRQLIKDWRDILPMESRQLAIEKNPATWMPEARRKSGKDGDHGRGHRDKQNGKQKGESTSVRGGRHKPAGRHERTRQS